MVIQKVVLGKIVLVSSFLFLFLLGVGNAKKALGAHTHNGGPVLKGSVLAGKATYNRYCTPCHGERGQGDGE